MIFYLKLPNSTSPLELGTLSINNTFWPNIGGGYSELIDILTKYEDDANYLNQLEIINDRNQKIELVEFVNFLSTINVKKSL